MSYTKKIANKSSQFYRDLMAEQLAELLVYCPWYCFKMKKRIKRMAANLVFGDY